MFINFQKFIWKITHGNNTVSVVSYEESNWVNFYFILFIYLNRINDYLSNNLIENFKDLHI